MKNNRHGYQWFAVSVLFVLLVAPGACGRINNRSAAGQESTTGSGAAGSSEDAVDQLYFQERTPAHYTYECEVEKIDGGEIVKGDIDDTTFIRGVSERDYEYKIYAQRFTTRKGRTRSEVNLVKNGNPNTQWVLSSEEADTLIKVIEGFEKAVFTKPEAEVSDRWINVAYEGIEFSKNSNGTIWIANERYSAETLVNTAENNPSKFPGCEFEAYKTITERSGAEILTQLKDLLRMAIKDLKALEATQPSVKMP